MLIGNTRFVSQGMDVLQVTVLGDFDGVAFYDEDLGSFILGFVNRFNSNEVIIFEAGASHTDMAGNAFVVRNGAVVEQRALLGTVGFVEANATKALEEAAEMARVDLPALFDRVREAQVATVRMERVVAVRSLGEGDLR